MNYGAFTDYNETNDLLEINGQQNNSELPSEMRLRRFTEPLFGAFRRDKKYLYVLLCGLLFIATLPFNISLFSKNSQDNSKMTFIETIPSTNSNNDNKNNNYGNNNINNAHYIQPNNPTAYPTYLDEDDDVYTDFYNRFDLRFTTYRDGYDVLSYFLPNASDLYAYKFLKPYTGVVEPYATMWISITDTGDDDVERKYNHKYTICDKNNDCLEDYDTETSFSYECDPLNDEYTITMRQYNAINGEYTGRTSEGNLLCMYVRREFRALTDDDLTKTVEAMYTMWSTDEDTGQTLYGNSYHNYVYLLEYHYFNAAWIDADHVHEGLWFLAQHIKMTNIFEKAMQAVEPSISLPYWDYTIETAYNISVWDSPMFQANTFGTLTLPTNLTWGWLYESDGIDDGKIPDGKWAYMTADYNTKYDELYTA
jgi:hypothetical protein